MTTLILELIENGTHQSLISEGGRLYATGTVSRELLREAGHKAKSDGYDSILIGPQSWDVNAVIADFQGPSDRGFSPAP